jgi:hypothetical protein
MRRLSPAPLLPLVLLLLAGCSSQAEPTRAPATPGRPLGRASQSVAAAPAPHGDPPAERRGTIPSDRSAATTDAGTEARAQSARAALAKYALAYSNWRAGDLVAHERQLARLAVGPARLTAEQTAASQSAIGQLVARHVRNEGVVVSIGAGRGPASARWVVVTRERTSGTGAYADLPVSLHVTFARTARHAGGWVISEWSPKT